MVQSRYRTHLAQRQDLIVVLTHGHKQDYQSCSTTTPLLTHRQYAIMLRRKRYADIQRRLEEYHEAVRVSFQQKGAGIILQKWWRRVPWRWRKALRLRKERRERAAAVLQVRADLSGRTTPVTSSYDPAPSLLSIESLAPRTRESEAPHPTAAAATATGVPCHVRQGGRVGRESARGAEEPAQEQRRPEWHCQELEDGHEEPS
jgi:hypothetical protein